MKSDRDNFARLLRWYPASWRDRYGEELVALMEDEWAQRGAPARYRWAIARAGLRERLHASGLIGHDVDAPIRLRSGSLLVLSAWMLFVVGGIGFQKTSEHFARALPLASRAPSQDAFGVVVAFAAVSALAVGAGTLASLPAVVRFFRAGGWAQVRRFVARAAIAGGLVVALVIPLSLWAHRLSEFQRNGGNTAYSWAIGAWALLVVATLVLATVAAIETVRRLTLPVRILRFEGALAVVVAASMAAITAGTAWWWHELSAHAAWFFSGSPSATTSPVSANMVVVVAIMSLGVLCAGLGVYRIGESWRHAT